eukprot:4279890-Ditylum_brightwellii.AAC.1
MVLGVKVTKVVFAWCPVHQEMPLCTAVSDPIEAHINCLGLALAHCGVDNPTCCGVIRHDRGGRLGVPHFGEGESQLFAFPHVGEEGPNFCPGC